MTLRKIDLMHRLLGKCDGHTCGECSNLEVYDYHGRTYRKCKAYGVTNSEASDWAKRWQGCGLFNKQFGDKPIIRFVRPTRKDKEEWQNTPIEGQISMEV